MYSTVYAHYLVQNIQVYEQLCEVKKHSVNFVVQVSKIPTDSETIVSCTYSRTSVSTFEAASDALSKSETNKGKTHTAKLYCDIKVMSKFSQIVMLL